MERREPIGAVSVEPEWLGRVAAKDDVEADGRRQHWRSNVDDDMMEDRMVNDMLLELFSDLCVVFCAVFFFFEF
jgi:hypothetical protein